MNNDAVDKKRTYELNKYNQEKPSAPQHNHDIEKPVLVDRCLNYDSWDVLVDWSHWYMNIVC